MNNGVRTAIAVAVVVAVFAVAWRALLHRSNLVPAIVTPQTNVHLEFSDALGARIFRVAHEPRGDDGPYPVFTPLLLDMLHDLGVPATFFLIGDDATQWPQLTRRIAASGEEIGDHTLTHPDLDRESPEQVRAEILGGRDVLWALSHDPATRIYMRPPHGRYTERTLQIAQELGYDVVLWTDDSGDWRTVTVGALQRHLFAHATAPEIVLLHSGKLATIEALPEVVGRFKKAGYRFVTVGELLHAVQTADLNHPLRRAV
jgi:peptidoglycan/xylan/chitin deacetylase (PgdA/CDA1 family)